MAVDLWMRGQWYPNVVGYSAVEDATPIDVSLLPGGFGQVSVTVPMTPEAKTLWNEDLLLRHGSAGEVRGVIRSGAAPSPKGTITLDGDSVLALTDVTRKMPPFKGTLGDAIRAYLRLVKIVNNVVIDESLENISVTLQGWNDRVSIQLTQLIQVYGAEMTYVAANIVFRPVRQRTAARYRDSLLSWGMDSSNVARSVEVKYYENSHQTDALAYPKGNWTMDSDVEVFQVDSGQTLEWTVEIDASLSSVTQPSVVDYMGPTTSNVSGYTVVGEGDKPISASQWRNEGGKVSVKIGDDSRTLIISVTGMDSPQFAPFRIAMTSGSSNYYPSLRILGTGVFFEEKVVTLETGISEDLATEEVGTTVENRNISTLKQAMDLGAWTLARYTGPQFTISLGSAGINAVGDNGSYRFPIIKEGNAEYAGLTLGQFDAQENFSTIRDFNEYWNTRVQSDFANQSFGNLAGARILEDFAYYRLTSATKTPAGMSASGEADTIVKDFNEVWAGATLADFNEQWDGKLIKDVTVRPLFRDPEFIDVSAPWPDTFYPDEMYPR